MLKLLVYKTYWIAPNTSHRRVNGVPLRNLGRFVYFSRVRTFALTRGGPLPRTTEQSPTAQHPPATTRERTMPARHAHAQPNAPSRLRCKCSMCSVL